MQCNNWVNIVYIDLCLTLICLLIFEFIFFYKFYYNSWITRIKIDGKCNEIKGRFDRRFFKLFSFSNANNSASMAILVKMNEYPTDLSP